MSSQQQSQQEKEVITDSGRIPLNPFGYSEKKERDIVLLVISDLHLDHKKIEKLKGWHKDFNNDIIDYVLVLGDFDNLIQEVNNVDFNESCRSEARITNLLNFLEFFSCPILIIPGNHDPQTMFESYNKQVDIPRMTQHSLNLHRRIYSINQNLHVMGFGGSVPAYQFPKGVKTLLWTGYPYATDNDYQENSQQFFEESLNLDDNKQYIVLTHNGPNSSSTTVQKDNLNEEEHIYSGSNYLDTVVYEYKSKIVTLLHGHTHSSFGRNNLYNVPVINPGSLTDGNFSKISLHKDSASQKWTLRSNQFLNLNSF